jgi:hypothetical protein
MAIHRKDENGEVRQRVVRRKKLEEGGVGPNIMPARYRKLLRNVRKR